MALYKQNDLSIESNSDSFETNLRQMEHTNHLLSTLEDKISNLFSTNQAPPSNPLEMRQPTSKISPSNASKIAAPFSSKVSSDIKDRYRLPLTSIENRSSHDYNYADNLLEKEPRECITQPYSSPEYSIVPSPIRYNASPLRNEYMRERSPLKVISEESPRNEVTTRLGAGMETSNISRRGTARGDEGYENVRDSVGGRLTKGNEGSFLDKMGNIERFYREKIEILEERIIGYEEETRQNARINDRLAEEVSHLKAVLHRVQHEEQARSSWEEERLAREEEWTRERRGFEKEIEELKRVNREILDEKEEYERRYEGILKVHREMIQLDMERNQKNLRNSQYEKYGRESENVKGMMELVEQYKGEVGRLRENNEAMRRQYEGEMERLREELEQERRENRRGGESVLNRSDEQRKSVVKKKEEDIKMMSGKDLADYVREWRDFYLEDDNKGGKSSEQENYRLFDGEKGKSKRIEESFGRGIGEDGNEII